MPSATCTYSPAHLPTTHPGGSLPAGSQVPVHPTSSLSTCSFHLQSGPPHELAESIGSGWERVVGWRPDQGGAEPLGTPSPQQLLAGTQPKALQARGHFRARARQNPRVGRAREAPTGGSELHPGLPTPVTHSQDLSRESSRDFTPLSLPTLSPLAFGCCPWEWGSNPQGVGPVASLPWAPPPPSLPPWELA